MPANPKEVSSSPAAAQKHRWRGYFYIAAATFFWGAAATVGKAVFNGNLFAGRAQISPLLLTQARTTFSLLVLAIFLLARHGRGFLRIGLRDLILCLLAGTLGVAGSNFFYYFAIEKTTVAIAITLQYTAPVWVLAYMVLRGRERAAWNRVLAVALALGGIALTIGLLPSGLHLGLGGAGGLAAAGAGAALLASFSYAFYNIVTPPLVRRHHLLKVMLYAVLGATALWAIVNPPWRLAAQGYNARQWAFLFAFACFSLLLPYALYFNGLKYLDATRAVIASCLEPVFAILFAAAFVGETLHGLQVAGILAVLGATVLAQGDVASGRK